MDYNKRLKDAQDKLNSLAAEFTTEKAALGDWNNMAWQKFVDAKKDVAREYDVHEGDLKYK